MDQEIQIQWRQEPEDKNYPAAESYLGLIYNSEAVRSIVSRLKDAPVVQFKAKDILRASGLSLLGISNLQVEKNLKKIESGKPLSPILLVRDTHNGKVVIADGYHRMCAVYAYNQDELIPCKIV